MCPCSQWCLPLGRKCWVRRNRDCLDSGQFLRCLLFLLYFYFCEISSVISSSVFAHLGPRSFCCFSFWEDKMGQWGREGLHADMWWSHDLCALTSTDPDLWPSEAFGLQICSGILSDLDVLHVQAPGLPEGTVPEGQKQRISGPLLQGWSRGWQAKVYVKRTFRGSREGWKPVTGKGIEKGNTGGCALRGRALRLIISTAQIRPCQLEAKLLGPEQIEWLQRQAGWRVHSVGPCQAPNDISMWLRPLSLVNGRWGPFSISAFCSDS